MNFLSGQTRNPILADIRDAVREGYFDDRAPSQLSMMTVQEVLDKVEMMSPYSRRRYLEKIGSLRKTQRYLSDYRKNKSKKTWLSR